MAAAAERRAPPIRSVQRSAGHPGLAAAALGAAILLAAPALAAGPAGHVALLSIDGLSPADYLDQERCGAGLVHLPSLMNGGAWAEGMAGVLPTVTYPAHATLVTGVVPATHGVLTNERPRDGADWHLDRADIGVPTLWDAARAAGRTVAVVTWPSSYGADVDWLIPEDLAYGEAPTERIRGGSTPGLFASLEEATGRTALLPFEHPDSGLPLDRMTASFAAAIVRRHRPGLLLAHFLDLDHRQHAHGPGSPAACAALRRIDALIGEIRSAYRDAGIEGATAFVVVSDHGFLPVDTVINLTLLRRQAAGGGGGSVEGITVRNNGGSAAFYLPPGMVARAEAFLRGYVVERLRREVRWLDRRAAARLGGFPDADFVLCAAPGHYFLAAEGSSELLLPSHRARGGHGFCPDEPGIDAAFLAGGAGIRARGAIPRLRMVDVAPTVAALLGLELPTAEGRPVIELLATPAPAAPVTPRPRR